jgi:hypothetical protein
MRRALLFCAAIAFAIACGDSLTDPVPDQTVATPPIAFATTTTEDGLSISTDKDDYQPGDTVHFTGSGWQPGDVLDIVLTDEPLTHEPHTWSVDVGADGMFHDSTYVVDEGDLNVAFTLVATSRATGRSLTVNFTDSQPQKVTLTPNSRSIPQAGTASYEVEVQVGGQNTDCTITLTVPTALPAGATAAFVGGNVVTTQVTFTKTLNISTLSTTPAGTTNFTVQAARGANCQGSGPEVGNGTLIVFGPATKLAFAQQPSNTQSASSITPAVTVQVLDAGNRLVANSSASINLAIATNPGSGALSGTLPQNAVNGVATFSNLSIDKIGTGYTLAASSAGLTSATSTAFNILIGPATKLAFTTQPGGAAPGSPLSPQPSVTIQDAGGNTVNSTASITLALILNGNSGVLTCTPSLSRNAVAGVASFTGCAVSLAGTGYQLRATSGSLTQAVSNAFDIVANNQAPIANAGADESGDEGSAIQLDGSGSSDPDGATDLPLTFAWSIVTPLTGFASGAACSLDDATLEKPSITCTDNGVVKVKLQVKDKRNLVSANLDQVEVTVNNAKPTATFAAAPATLNEGSSYTLSLTSPSDPSSVDVAAGFTYSFDCGLGAGYSTPTSSASATCPTTDNGSPTAKGKIIDKDGGLSEYTAAVTINNVAPTATFDAPSQVEEGSPIALSLTEPHDPSTADVSAGFHYAFDCGSGYGSAVSYATAGTDNTKNCPTTDDATVTVNGKIFDKNDGVTEYTKENVIVKNVAPIVDAGDDQDGTEGQTFNLTGSFTDPGADSHTWSWAYVDGVPHPAACEIDDASSLHTTITCKDNGEVIVTLTVEDDDHGVGKDDLTLKIANVAPSASALNTNSPVDEGSSITLSLAGVTDPSEIDAASLHYAFDCGTGAGFSASNYAGASTANSASCPTNDNGTRTVKGKVFDKDGGVSSAYYATVTINNVAPTATALNTNSPVNEGNSISLSLDGVFDPSTVDAGSLHYAFDCGTGYGTATDYAHAGSTNSATCPTNDNGTRSVNGKVFDKDGGANEYTASVTIENVAPTATFYAPNSVDEGSNIALNLTGPFDPSSADVADGLLYAFDCGDGAGFSSLSKTITSKTCSTTDNGTRTVKGKIQDKDGGVSEYSKTVTINNVAPTITNWTPLVDPVIFGSTVTFSVAFTDPGADTHKAKYDCGNGAGYGAEVSATSPYGYSCTFSSIGDKTIKITITDKDGGAAERTYKFTVAYTFSGFFAPVDRPNTMNISKVGQAIPLKWRLTDAAGHGVPGVSATIQAYDISCALGSTSDVVEEYAGNSGLQDLGDGYYQYNWKTPSSYLNSCKRIALTFAAGGIGYTTKEPVAYFTFKK